MSELEKALAENETLKGMLLERAAQVVILEERIRELEAASVPKRTTCPPEARDPVLFRPIEKKASCI